ncbi:MAG TPA: peptidase S8, partial [Bacteroidetes bacterium]|nr:peptidase S8 [Bacteroidota bacterium]
KFSLHQNYPNPFNPVTNIKFSIPKSGNVSLKVYDILGREVAELVDEFKPQGNYLVDFNASFLSSGVYFYRLETSEFTEVKKMVLVK